MEIKVENGYIRYSVEEGEIVIDSVEVFSKRQGTGKMLVNKVKKIAQSEGKPCTLAAYPQDDSISKADLCAFYESLGFECEYRGSEKEPDLYIYE